MFTNIRNHYLNCSVRRALRHLKRQPGKCASASFIEPRSLTAASAALLLFSQAAQATGPYEEMQGNENPLAHIAEAGAKPAFADIDKDGDLDLFVGSANGRIKYYENTGSAGEPEFVERTGTANPLDGVNVVWNSAPALADLDNDGNIDAFSGMGWGNIITGSVNASAFDVYIGTDNPFDEANAGRNSVPSVADIDGDNDLDAFIGAWDGSVRYYENTGTPNGPVFEERTGTDNPLNGADVGKNSTPALTDFDEDGDLDAFIGAEDGSVHYYENTGNPNEPVFEKRMEVDVGMKSAPVFVDIDNDGDRDVFIGAEGGVHFYKNKAADNNRPPDPFSLIYPVNGVTVPFGATRFEWEAAVDPDGDPVTYTLEIALDLEFTDVIFTQKGLSQTTFTVEAVLEPDRTYFWVVTAGVTKSDVGRAHTESCQCEDGPLYSCGSDSSPPACAFYRDSSDELCLPSVRADTIHYHTNLDGPIDTIEVFPYAWLAPNPMSVNEPLFISTSGILFIPKLWIKNVSAGTKDILETYASTENSSLLSSKAVGSSFTICNVRMQFRDLGGLFMFNLESLGTIEQ
ncbi:MAG: hypothetical protein GY869_11465 [Planctomycetes bacterium]|nr:hypothetical protein [Planctomycetota bacterium]